MAVSQYISSVTAARRIRILIDIMSLVWNGILGYYGDGFNAMIVLSACHLPDKRRHDYDYVMDNLFL